MVGRPGARRRWGASILAAVFLSLASALPNEMSVDNVKAGFILNFARYTEWPTAKLDGEGLIICGLSRDPLSGQLAMLRGRRVQEREIHIRTPASASEWSQCQVLFIGRDETQRIAAVLSGLEQHPVLTVSDTPDFARRGGIIGMKLRAGRIRFDINQGVALRSGLNLSSHLLKLADEVLH